MQYLQTEKVVDDDSWSFREIDRLGTSYLTHSYHRYPAKFIPQLAARLIKENSQAGELVCDPFMGSGTTLVEAIVNNRRTYGTDINPVAVMITRAKTTPIDSKYLEYKISILKEKIKPNVIDENKQTLFLKKYDDFKEVCSENKRIDYWFPEKQKHDLTIILSGILMVVEDENIRNFLLCAFSNILKGCSRWMMKSVKPTIDKNKTINDAYGSFFIHTQRMLKKNRQLWNMLEDKKVDCTVDNVDASKMRINDGSVALIVTSPPYVTSYEYADLHQLTAIWLGYTKNLPEFRSKFIGSIQKKEITNVRLYSDLGRTIVDELRLIDKREANGVEQYFFDMQKCFEEMYRILKFGARTSIVIGDTDIKKVKIHNAYVFVQTLEKIGFKVYNIIKRPIRSKVLPLTRDEKTGRFVATMKSDRLAYPFEYILIMEKA
jgi:DNA modification methylase